MADQDNDYNLMKKAAGGSNKHIATDHSAILLVNGPLKVSHTIEFNSINDYEIVITCNMFLIINDKFKGVIQLHNDPDLFFYSDVNRINMLYNST